MKLPKPNPKVYRLAAELIADGENFSCCAIYRACRALKISDNTSGLYHAQYVAMFGDLEVSIIEKQHFYYCKYSVPVVSAEKHPFWNCLKTQQRQEYRMNALLLMAAIVENPA